VLIYVFASFLALLPLLMAAIAIPTTFLLVGGLTYLTPVSIIVEFLIALIGLGVATDYSLLVVTRWRENRAPGTENQAAVVSAMNSAGRAAVFSWLTVACRPAPVGGILTVTHSPRPACIHDAATLCGPPRA